MYALMIDTQSYFECLFILSAKVYIVPLISFYKYAFGIK